MTEHIHGNDMRVELLCTCGDAHSATGWAEFLRQFSDDEVLPERRSPLVLRVVFTGLRGRSKGAQIDATLRTVLEALVRRGAVRQADGHFEIAGFCSRSCSNAH